MTLIYQIKEELELHLIDQFRISPEKSKIKLYNLPEWIAFKKSIGSETYAPGCYTVRDNTSHILNSPDYIQTLFHEHFGHGFHLEHSRTGRHLTNLEQEAHKAKTTANPRTPKALKRFRATDPSTLLIAAEKTKYLTECEGFSIWMQYYLSNITRRQEEYIRTFRKSPEVMRNAANRCIEYQHSYGKHALLYSLGFPKHYNKEIMEDLLRKLYPSNNIKFALLYGSRKPHSDIDMFIVSDNIPSTHNNWLDISSVNTTLFEELVSKLDISVTDPLFSGELILGDEKYLEQTKKKITNTPITPEQIAHHKQHAEKAKQLAMQTTNPKEHQTAMRYNKSYTANAEELSKGRKALTLKKLISTYPNHFN
ncbi:MAG: hypothetical protein V1914_04165 [archaeon]